MEFHDCLLSTVDNDIPVLAISIQNANSIWFCSEITVANTGYSFPFSWQEDGVYATTMRVLLFSIRLVHTFLVARIEHNRELISGSWGLVGWQHGYCLSLLADHLKPGMHVLDVGSGSGYLTAIFALMVCILTSNFMHFNFELLFLLFSTERSATAWCELLLPLFLQHEALCY